MNPPATEAPTQSRTILLLGNPNTGKSSLFVGLTGTRQRIANVPGVTVEARVGTWIRGNGRTTVVDLPGSYSLAARTPDEEVVTEALLGRLDGIPAPDVAVVVVDASTLERNLYLTSQVLEHDIPVVVALTMLDVADSRGKSIDEARLAAELGVPVVRIHPPSRTGFVELGEAIDAASVQKREPAWLEYPDDVVGSVGEMEALLRAEPGRLASGSIRPLALRLLVDGRGPLLEELSATRGQAFTDTVKRIRTGANGTRNLPLIEAQTRYDAIQRITAGAKREEADAGPSVTDRIDAVLTHRLWGSLILVLVFGLIFQAIYSWSGPAMDAIDGGFGAFGEWVAPRLPEGAIRGLVVDGVIAGVGGVLVFLPQIVVLFLFIALLEDIGYMSRAAFLMDRIMARFGLSGRSFIPLLSSFACAIPGIMGARTIDDRRSRLTTIFLAPFMSCSARLPVYVLMIGAFVPQRELWGFWELQGLVLLLMYLVGILVAIPTAMAIQHFAFTGLHSSFLMELPSYKLPRARNVGMVLWQRAGSFVKRAGTMILAVTIVVWFLGYYPRNAAISAEHDTMRAALENPVEGTAPLTPEERQVRLDEIDHAEAGALLRQSFLGRMGRGIEPVVRPLGWDWRIGMAVIASFPAREVVIGTLGTIFNLGESDEESEPLKEVLRSSTWPDGRPLFTLATALSLMVFFALCAQCAATLAVMKKETNSWKWPLASFAYMTGVAYVAALLTYRVTLALGVGA